MSKLASRGPLRLLGGGLRRVGHALARAARLILLALAAAGPPRQPRFLRHEDATSEVAKGRP